MIAANELRINNWVNKSYFGEERSEYFQITKGFEIDSAEELYYPIPLTPELLVRCGFEKEKIHNGFSFKKEIGRDGFKLEICFCKGVQEYTDFKIIGNGCYDDCGEMSLNEILKYLHQLQNLYFALTGEELNIEL